MRLLCLEWKRGKLWQKGTARGAGRRESDGAERERNKEEGREWRKVCALEWTLENSDGEERREGWAGVREVGQSKSG